MGYYTQYSLRQLGDRVAGDAFVALISGDESATHALDQNGDTRQPEKWYEHEKTLCAWSAKYPKTAFVLHAEGEDSDGIWDKYFLGGELVHVESFNGLPEIDLDTLQKWLTANSTTPSRQNPMS